MPATCRTERYARCRLAARLLEAGMRGCVKSPHGGSNYVRPRRSDSRTYGGIGQVRLRASGQTCVRRAKTNSHFGGSRKAISAEVVQRFRLMPNADFG